MCQKMSLAGRLPPLVARGVMNLSPEWMILQPDAGLHIRMYTVDAGASAIKRFSRWIVNKIVHGRSIYQTL